MSIELEVGELKGKLSGMEKRMEDLETKVDALSAKVDRILEKVSEARGGWKLLAFTVTAVIALWEGTIVRILKKLIS